jgi:hypothetical protein
MSSKTYTKKILDILFKYDMILLNNGGKPMTTLKSVKTTKEYKTKFKGYDITVPIGSTVINSTALGYDDNYRFLCQADCRKIAQKVTGYKTSGLLHDLTYTGLNIPAEYCESY